MKPRKIRDDVYWMGSVDWDSRLFDALIPLPDGTSYNAYFIKGTERSVLIDTVDPPKAQELMEQLKEIQRLDYIISLHAEQDHAGTLPHVLQKFPEARIIATPKGKNLLMQHLDLPEHKIHCVDDGEALSLGDKTLTFIHTPWVHWPETMVAYLNTDKILFSCDFMGSHYAASDLYVTDQGVIYEAAKRYFAEILMPFRPMVKRNLEKLKAYDIEMIAPSHGQIYPDPSFILDAYKVWTEGIPRNTVVIPYVSMHGSTGQMVDYLVSALVERDVRAEQFNLAVTDIGKLACSLVDAATIVVGTPTVLAGPHPYAAYAAFLANALKPTTQFVSIIGSFGWGGKTVEVLAGMLPNLKAEIIDPVLCKGKPGEIAYQELDQLADTIAAKHQERGYS
ncbi:MAG: MBL fold hydrolase [Deltaproteobacteria bacterium]|nr:MAG: MBL fold hydrolase [Deltaproteobacteria bacterium]